MPSKRKHSSPISDDAPLSCREFEERLDAIERLLRHKRKRHHRDKFCSSDREHVKTRRSHSHNHSRSSSSNASADYNNTVHVYQKRSHSRSKSRNLHAVTDHRTAPSPIPNLGATAIGQTATNTEILIGQDIELEHEILSILETDSLLEKAPDFNLHSELSKRWSYILNHGLDNLTKSDLLKNKYKVLTSYSSLLPPQLNPELKQAVPDLFKKKDSCQQMSQKKLGLGLVPLAQALNMLITSPSTSNSEQLLPLLVDAGRILTNLFFYLTKSRRHTILQNVNKAARETIKNVPPDEFLFGKDLGDQLKAAKGLHRSSQDLKPLPSGSSVSNLVIPSSVYRTKKGGSSVSTRKQSNTSESGSRLNYRSPSSRFPTNQRQKGRNHF